jgi:DNA-binding transcriptional MerR regulator
MLIGEVARATGLSKDGIRHYEVLGLITSTPRQAGSKTYRDYDRSVLETIEMIRGAKRFLGLPLKKIGPLLHSIADNPPPKEKVIEYLEERLVVIRDKIASLREVEDYLDQKIERWCRQRVQKRERKSGRCRSIIASKTCRPFLAAGEMSCTARRRPRPSGFPQVIRFCPTWARWRRKGLAVVCPLAGSFLLPWSEWCRTLQFILLPERSLSPRRFRRERIAGSADVWEGRLTLRNRIAWTARIHDQNFNLAADTRFRAFTRYELAA